MANHFPSLYFQIAEILNVDHDVPKEVAITAAMTYLKTFRRCPENPDIPLDEWRLHLWSEALPDAYKGLARPVYQDWVRLRYKYLKPNADVLSMLRKLRQHYLMALITNGESNSQWEKVHQLNIEKYFDCVLVSGDLPWQKPQPEIFYAACKYLGVPPAQCAMVGDKLETDIKVCMSAGRQAIAIRNHVDADPQQHTTTFTHSAVTALSVRHRESRQTDRGGRII